jgi:uroporphyrinogen III methyltransferase/synthase
MRDVIAERLRSAGRTVESVAAYATSSVRDPEIAEAAERADVWTFTSASTVRGFVANVPDASALARTKLVACIGPVTADAAREAGLAPAVVAAEYTVDGLIAALELATAR